MVYLEQYLLSLYRKRFDHQILSVSTEERRLEIASDTNKESTSASERSVNTISEKEITSTQSSLVSPGNSNAVSLKECMKQMEPEAVLDSSIHRSHSTLSHQSVYSIDTSPVKTQAKAVDSFRSLPLSMLEVSFNN